jgi:Flp pilus assembly protein TadD
MEKIKKHYFWFLPALLSAIIYFNSLKGTFFWDDRAVIFDNPLIKSWTKSLSTFLPHYWLKVHPGIKGQYRPLRNITFTFDYSLWHNNPFGYHLTNYLLNIFVVILVSFVAKDIFSSENVALISATLFAIHPAHIENVNYIKNRSDILCLLFILLSFYLFMKNRNILSILTYILALLAKEFAVMFPAVLLIYVFVMKKNRQTILHLIPYFIFAGLFLIMKFTILKVTVENKIFDPNVANVNHFWLIVSTFVNYLYLLFSPVKLAVDRTMTIYTTFFDWRIIILFVFFIIAVVLLPKTNFKTQYYFAISWLVLFLLPVSNIFVLSGRVFAEQRLYVPSFGGVILISGLIKELSDKDVLFSRILHMFILGLVIFFGLKIINRNYLWQDEILLWQQALKDDPRNLRALDNLAAALFRKGDFEQAEKIYEKIITLWPTNDGAYTNLGIIAMNKRDLDKAEKCFIKAVEISGGDAQSYTNLGSIYLLKGDKNKAKQFYEQAIRLDPDAAQVYTNLGIIYVSEKKFKEAAAMFKKAVELNPDLIEARLNLASVYRDLGLEYEAKQEEKEANLRIKTGAVAPQYNPEVIIKWSQK